MNKTQRRKPQTFRTATGAQRSGLSILLLAALAPAGVWAQTASPAASGGELETVEIKSERQGQYTSPVAVGGKVERALREIPNSISVITQERIQEQGLVTVTDALNQTPGVTVISNDTSQSQFYSRGYSLGIAYDGIPARTSLGGYQQFDLAAYERVEVLRGPAGVLQGTDEPGGVVNLVRKRAKRDFEASVAASAGSWNNYRTELDVTGPLNAEGTLRARGVVALTDRDYFYDAAHTRKWLGYGTVEYDITPDTTLSLIAAAQNDSTRASYSGLPAWTTGGLIKAPRSTNASAPWARTEWRTEELAAELAHRFNDDWKAVVKLTRRSQDYYWKDAFALDGVDPATNTINAYRRRIGDYEYRRNSVDAYVSGAFQALGRKHDVLLGFNYDGFTNSGRSVNASPDIRNVPFGGADQIPELGNIPFTSGSETQNTQRGVYGQVRLHVAEPLKVLVGGRLSTFESRNRAIAPSVLTNWVVSRAAAKNEFTPYVGAVLDVTKQVSLYASLAEIFVPQTQQRLDGTTLDPRKGRQWEVGSKAALLGGALNVSAALYNLRDSGRSQADPTNALFAVNAGKVESKGWEVEASGSPAPGYGLQAGYTRADTNYLVDARNAGLTFQTWQPRHTFKIWGTRRFSEGQLAGLTLGAGATAASNNRAGDGTSAIRRQGGYAAVSLLASYPVTDRTTVALNINNLFDRTYYTRLGGTNTYNSYGDPRNVSIALRHRF